MRTRTKFRNVKNSRQNYVRIIENQFKIEYILRKITRNHLTSETNAIRRINFGLTKDRQEYDGMINEVRS